MAITKKYSEDIFQWLLSLNYSLVNITDDKGRTILHQAVTANRIDLVEVLIASSSIEDCRIDFNVTTINGDTALHIAASMGYADLITVMVKSGKFDVKVKDEVSKFVDMLQCYLTSRCG